MNELSFLEAMVSKLYRCYCQFGAASVENWKCVCCAMQCVRQKQVVCMWKIMYVSRETYVSFSQYLGYLTGWSLDHMHRYANTQTHIQSRCKYNEEYNAMIYGMSHPINVFIAVASSMVCWNSIAMQWVYNKLNKYNKVNAR